MFRAQTHAALISGGAWMLVTAFLRAEDVFRGHGDAMAKVAAVAPRVVGVGLIAAAATLLWPAFVGFLRDASRSLAVRLSVGGLLWLGLLTTLFVIADAWPVLGTVTIGVLCMLMYVPIFLALDRSDRRPDAAGRVCGRCRYERPAERAAINERCAECGNYWWKPRSLASRRSARGDFHGSRPAKERFAAGARAIFASAACVLLGLAIFGFPSYGKHVVGLAPSSLLRTLARSEDRMLAEAAWTEMLDGRSTTQAERDGLMSLYIERRASSAELPLSAAELIAEQVVTDAVSPALVERMFESSVEFGFTASVAADRVTLSPRLHLEYETLWPDVKPQVFVAGVRVGDRGPFVAPATQQATLPWFANTFNVRNDWSPDRPFTEASLRAGGNHRPTFTTLTMPTPLEPGGYTLTLRLHLVSVKPSDRVALVQHSFFDPNTGAVAPFADAIWQRTYDLTTTVVVE